MGVLIFAFFAIRQKTLAKKRIRGFPLNPAALPTAFLWPSGVLSFYKRDAEGANRAPSAGGLFFFAIAFSPHHGCVVGETV